MTLPYAIGPEFSCLDAPVRRKGKRMRKNYVTFYSPGTIFQESRTLPIAEWDPALATSMSNDVVERHGARPYAFQFSTYLEVDPVPDGEGGYADVGPKRVDCSRGLHYIGGRLETYDDVRRREDPGDLILLSNMRNNSWWVTVVNERSFRVTRPFEAEDTLLDPETGAVWVSGSDERLVEYRKAKDEWRERLARSPEASDGPQ